MVTDQLDYATLGMTEMLNFCDDSVRPSLLSQIIGLFLSFSKIRVMESLRKPKRITIRGSDEQEYPFLVKGGEDLRQDQRIEQLFDVMNIILSQNATCSQRNMQLKTYQVIPMTTRYIFALKGRESLLTSITVGMLESEISACQILLQCVLCLGLMFSFFSI